MDTPSPIPAADALWVEVLGKSHGLLETAEGL